MAQRSRTAVRRLDFALTDLFLHGREVGTVFDLLGSKENDLTYALGWALAQSANLLDAVVSDTVGESGGDVTSVRLQEFGSEDRGFTDIEIETISSRLVIEAKRGWTLPSDDQLLRYAPRIKETGGKILVVSECSDEFASANLPPAIDGIEVQHRRWHWFALAADQVYGEARLHEKRILRDLSSYFRGLMKMQQIDSNEVYVVSLATNLFEGSDLHFDTVVMEKNRYFHPVGGMGNSRGWPKEPPNYLGFRFHGKLQRVSFVEDYVIRTRPHDEIPEIHDYVDWSDEPHFIYKLGPNILGEQEVRTGNLYRGARVRVALDLLLTCHTIAEARDRTQERLEASGGQY